MKSKQYICIGASAAIAGFLTIAFLVWTLVPYLQMSRYGHLLRSAAKSDDTTVVAQQSLAYEPYNYLEPELRDNQVSFLMDAYEHDPRPINHDSLLFGIHNLETAVAHDGNYPQYYLTLGRSYTLLAQSNKSPDGDIYLSSAAQDYQKALALEPGNPEIIYAYAVNLINQADTEQALSLLTSVAIKDPGLADTDYYIGLAYFKSGPSYYTDAIASFERAFDEYKVPDQAVQTIYTTFFSYFYKTKDIERFLTAVRRLEIIDENQINQYDQIDAFVTKTNTLPPITINQ